MNMCLLEVAICEKCRNSHFQSEGGSKKFEQWGGIEKFLGLGGLPIWGGYFCWGDQYPITCHKQWEHQNKV